MLKHQIFMGLLDLLRQISIRIQIGNPYGKAPSLIDQPDEKDRLVSKFNNADNLSVWKLSNVLCCVSLYHHVSLSYGVVINRFNQVYSCFFSFPWGNKFHPVLSYPYLGKKVAKLEKAILLMTPEAEGNYYHWMTDLLPRLLLIIKYSLSDFQDRTILLHSAVRAYETDTFKLLGLSKASILRISKLEYVEVEDLIVADYKNYRELFPTWKKELLDEMLPQNNFHNASSYKKIYLLRGKQKKRKLIGEERLVLLLKEQGFTIVDPQTLSLQEQIKILGDVDLVVALHGAALTNTIFCKKGTRIVELRNNDKSPEYFSEIAKTYQLQFQTVSLPPVRKHKNIHLANKENLILTDEGISELMKKIETITV